ncbi:MAG: hypothetical protein IRZ03_08250 [Acidobacterium ailaaui]|nr:hypothetical protein [Pseudacidobacterium ailaaui]
MTSADVRQSVHEAALASVATTASTGRDSVRLCWHVTLCAPYAAVHGRCMRTIGQLIARH